MRKRTFVGRKSELDQFKTVLNTLPKIEKSPDISCTILIHGIGGMGKSSLCQEFQKIAKSMFPEMLQLEIDWETEKGLGSSLRPDEMLNAVARTIPEAYQKYLKKYYNTQKDSQKVQKELDRLLEQRQQMADAATSGAINVAKSAVKSCVMKNGSQIIL